MLHCKKCEHLLLSNCEIGEMLFPVSAVPSCLIVPELWFTHRDCSGSESKLFFVRQQFLFWLSVSLCFIVFAEDLTETPGGRCFCYFCSSWTVMLLSQVLYLNHLLYLYMWNAVTVSDAVIVIIIYNLVTAVVRTGMGMLVTWRVWWFIRPVCF